MNLSNLKPAKGSIKKEKRIGRGQGSGKGGTSTRGHKGAKSRSGYKSKAGFEGGQMPLQRRVPKGGFKNPFRIEYVGFNLDKIQEYVDKYKLKSIDIESLHKHKLIKKTDKVKILGRGELKAAVSIKVHAFTATAKEAIEKAGGTAETI
jgi:large subunit ribosomal protein L15